MLLITPPLLQTNAPYPATAYLAGYLTSRGYAAAQADLSAELLNEVFSSAFLHEVFDTYQGGGDEGIERIYSMRGWYISTVDAVMAFLRGEDATMATLICHTEFLPQGPAFGLVEDPEADFGAMGVQDLAKHLCTLYLHDISAFIRAAVSPHFEMVRYGEKIAAALSEFEPLEQELANPLNILEERMVLLLDRHIEAHKPDVVGFTIPFPGNLPATLRCAQHIRKKHPNIKIVAGGGYPSTELRSMTDKKIFAYFDYIVLDDGALPLERILSGGELLRTYTKDGYHSGEENVPFAAMPAPDFSGLPHELYFSLLERTNPMHRLWSDGRWNKMMLAHGCYWARCAFCDTSLDYICRYEPLKAPQIVDQMERIVAQTGSRGFHFVDEAASPALLREVSLEIIRRGLRVAWWTNIRFEKGFTGDLCRLMSAAGCVAVSGGLEAPAERLLEMVGKGVTVEQATMALRNFLYAGIMAHTYLMYGLPTQTLQESIDSLEVVRQMFRAELITSAFWHRFAMTVHSPIGREPEKFGARRKNDHVNTFANNEIYFPEDRGYNINLVGDALREALDNYMDGAELTLPAHKWFAGKAPQTTVEPTLITDQLIKPDQSRIFAPEARLVWIGGQVRLSDEGLVVAALSEDKTFRFGADSAFMAELAQLCSDLNRRVTLSEVAEIYARGSAEPFSTLYHSKRWDKMRETGLLQL